VSETRVSCDVGVRGAEKYVSAMPFLLFPVSGSLESRLVYLKGMIAPNDAEANSRGRAHFSAFKSHIDAIADLSEAIV
jgi:hypothetical protein